MLVQQRNCGLCGMLEGTVNGTDGHDEGTLDTALHAHHSCVKLEHQEGRLLENHDVLVQ